MCKWLVLHLTARRVSGSNEDFVNDAERSIQLPKQVSGEYLRQPHRIHRYNGGSTENLCRPGAAAGGEWDNTGHLSTVFRQNGCLMLALSSLLPEP